MPVLVDAELRRMSQAEFGPIAYAVMERAFEVRRELGPSFDEGIYQRAIVVGLPDARTEVSIKVSYGNFRKNYYLDLLIEHGAVFEIKVAEAINPRHRAQLLNYLLLCNLQHGKLINMRPPRIEHEFVNSHVEHADRTGFSVDDAGWCQRSPVECRLKELFLDILHDWGTSLAIPLYEEAITHFLGGEESVLRDVEVRFQSCVVGQQPMRLLTSDSAFRITNINRPTDIEQFKQHLQRVLAHTNLKSIQWINMTLRHVTFQTITRPTR